MSRLVKIDDIIKYLNVMKKHGQYISEAEITTEARFEFDNIDIKIRIPNVRLESWAIDHKEFFKSDNNTNEDCNALK